MARSRTHVTTAILIVLGFVTMVFVPATAQSLTFCNNPETEGRPSSTLERAYTDLVVDLDRVRLDTGGGSASFLPLRGAHYLGSGPGTLLFDVIVTNEGRGPSQTGDVPVRIRVTQPSGEDLVHTVTVAIPGAGSSNTVQTEISLGDTGRHVLRLQVNPTQSVSEECIDDHHNPQCGYDLCKITYYHNNIQAYGLILGALPDLQVESMSTTGPVRATKGPSPDSRVTIHAVLKNDGPVPAHDHAQITPTNGPFHATFSVTGCDCKGVTVTVPWIAPGATRNIEATLPVHGLATQFEAILTIDPDGSVAVANPAKKVHAQTFPIPTPDLSATVRTDLPIIDGRAVAPQGEPLEFEVHLQNLGTARAANTHGGPFTVLVSRDGTSNVVLSHETTLDAHSNLTLKVRDDKPGLKDRHEYLIRLDTMNEVLDADRGNNEGRFRITVAQYQIGLHVAAADAHVTIPPGVTAQVPFEIRNEGTVPDTHRLMVPSGDRDATTFIDPSGNPVQEVHLRNGETYKGTMRYGTPPAAETGDSFKTILQAVSVASGVAAERDIRFTIGEDTVPPTITLEDPKSGFISRNEVVIRVVDNVEVASVETDLSGTFQPILPDDPDGSLYTINTTGMPSSFKITIRATDTSGNVATKTFDLRRDTTPPRIADITFIPAQGARPGQPVTILVDARDENMDKVTAEITQNRGFGNVYRENQTFTRTPTTYQLRDWIVPDRPGHYTFHITAYDRAGNTATSSKNLIVSGLNLQAPPNFLRPVVQPAAPNEGDRVQFTWLVQNTSPTFETGEFLVVFVVDDRRQVDGQWLNLGPGEIRPVTLSWTATPGPHIFTLVLDQADTVSEDDESISSNLVQHTTQVLFPDHPLFAPQMIETQTGGLGNRLLEYWYFPLLVLAVAALFVVAIALGRRTDRP